MTRPLSNALSVVVLCMAQLGVACTNAQTGDMSLSGEGSASTDAQLEITNATCNSSSVGTDLTLTGNVPSGRLSLVRVSFFSASGDPAKVNTNGDGVPDATVIDIPVDHDANGQTFSIDVPLNKTIVANVSRVGIQVVNQDGDPSNIVYANLDGSSS